MNYLRPVGTEFWGNWFTESFSTRTKETRLKYVVVAHVECGYNRYSHPILREEIKAIEMETRDPEQLGL